MVACAVRVSRQKCCSLTGWGSAPLQELCLLPLESREKLPQRGLCWGRRREEVAQCLGWWFRQGVPHWVVPSPAPALLDCLSCFWSRGGTGRVCWWVCRLTVWWGNLLWVFHCYLCSIPRKITDSRNLCVLYFVIFSFIWGKHLLKQLPDIQIKKKKKE